MTAPRFPPTPCRHPHRYRHLRCLHQPRCLHPLMASSSRGMESGLPGQILTCSTLDSRQRIVAGCIWAAGPAVRSAQASPVLGRCLGMNVHSLCRRVGLEPFIRVSSVPIGRNPLRVLRGLCGNSLLCFPPVVLSRSGPRFVPSPILLAIFIFRPAPRGVRTSSGAWSRSAN